jgi:hypothetical protein
MARHGVLALIQMVGVVGALGAALIVDARPAMPAAALPLPPKPAPAIEPVRHFAEPPPPVVVSPTGVAECDELLVQLDRYARCEALPAESRDAVRQAMAQIAQSFRDLPEEQRLATAAGCAQAVASMLASPPPFDC